MRVLISGPIASGKSTLARRVGADLAGRDVRAAVVDLDVVHDMLVSAASEQSVDDLWGLARRGVSALAASFEADGIAAVIVDGSYPDAASRAGLIDSDTVAGHSTSIVVSLNVSYAEALRRARSDPTRGVSRDPAFLSSYYDVRPTAAAAASDLVIDTEAVDEDSAASSIVAAAIERLSMSTEPGGR